MVMFGWRHRKSKLEITRIVVVAFLLATLIFSLYFWRLGTLTSGLGPVEVDSRAASSSLQQVADSPVYAPHKVLSYASQKVFGPSTLALRSVSVMLAILFLVFFYQLVKGWFGKIIGFFATLLLAATPWFILLARSGGPEIFLLAPIIVLASYYWLIRSKRWPAWLVLVVSSGLVAYLPGGILLIFLGAVIARRDLYRAAGSLGRFHKFLGTVTLLFILSPLAYAGVKNPSALKLLLLIPADWPSIWIVMKSAAWDVLALFYRTPQPGDFIIGRLPMFYGVQIILALFGSFALFKLARSKLYLLIAVIGFGVLAAAVNRNLAFLSLVLPAVALAVAAGLRYLYMEWRRVFPKNPLPKYLALVLIASLVGMHVFYGLRYSLIAWPNSAATRSTYVLK